MGLRKKDNQQKVLKKKALTPAHQITIEAYGVKLGVRSVSWEIVEEIGERLKSLLPNGFGLIPEDTAEHLFEIRRNSRGVFSLYKNGEKLTSTDHKQKFLDYLDSLIRLAVAEFAAERVFIHAGAVGWRGKAIIIPARSFQGKTTLVAELAKLGAEYYSDEYAVLDARGLVHPFPKTLSMRGIIDDQQQVELPVEELGGVKGSGPIPVGMVLITEYKTGARWRPRLMSEGLGVMAMLSHTIPIRYNPKFTLKVLNKTTNRAIIVKTKRGEAKEFAIKLLRFFDDRAF